MISSDVELSSALSRGEELESAGHFAEASELYFHALNSGGVVDSQSLFLSSLQRANSRCHYFSNEMMELFELRGTDYCAFCKAKRNLQPCNSCFIVFYCSNDHQQQHWSKHERICREFAAYNAETHLFSDSPHLPLPIGFVLQNPVDSLHGCRLVVGRLGGAVLSILL